MADDDDLRALKSGADDLVRRDFRQGDLVGIDASNRYFDEAHLQYANFSNANLHGSSLNKASTLALNLTGADVSSVTAVGTVFHSVKFRNANLANAKMRRSRFIKCDFSGADLRGANFEQAEIGDDTTFEDCIFDADTSFEGAKIFRPIAKQPVFDGYNVERGVLIRKSLEQETSVHSKSDINGPAGGAAEGAPSNGEEREPQPNSNWDSGEFDNSSWGDSPETAGTAIYQTGSEANEDQPAGITLHNQMLERIASLEQKLDSLTSELSPIPAHGGIGHNNPPEEPPLSEVETKQVLSEIRSEIQSSQPNEETIRRSKDKLLEIIAKLGSWSYQKSDLFADEFFKSAGKT